MDTKDSVDFADFRAYFADETSMPLFALIHLDGEIRMKLLGIDQELYESKKKAKRWRDNLLKKVHPDHCNHTAATIATANLDKIYQRMTKNDVR